MIRRWPRWLRARSGGQSADWHEDKTWKTQPGPYCAWCPVRRWCPDNEVWQNGPAKPGQDAAVSPAPVPAPDEPPF